LDMPANFATSDFSRSRKSITALGCKREPA
jgi:hypothetical protein